MKKSINEIRIYRTLYAAAKAAKKVVSRLGKVEAFKVEEGYIVATEGSVARALGKIRGEE